MKPFALALVLGAPLVLGTASALHAQALARRTTPSTSPAEAVVERPRVFLDCNGRCDFDFLRTEIRFVDYVRSHKDADVHILVRTRQTGAGGTEFTFDVVGLRQFGGMKDELRLVTRPVDSRDDVRRDMARVLKAGLVRYALQTPAGDGLRIGYAAPREGEESARAAVDPWDAWVFRTRFGGLTSAEATYKRINLDASVSANRTTEDWKTRLSASTRHQQSTIQIGEGKNVTSIQRDHSAWGMLVRSLDNHWSAGARASAVHSTFRNRDLSLRIAPALEYSFFPYQESSRRQLTLQYSVGANQIDYMEETIFGKTHEVLLDEALNAAYDITQRWGSVRTSLEGSHYFHDKSKYRLEARGNLDLRLTRALSLNFHGNAERIHDQLHLVKGNRSPEEILLRQKQVATSFRYYGSVGLGVSFGSIYNSVVNPRLGD